MKFLTTLNIYFFCNSPNNGATLSRNGGSLVRPVTFCLITFLIDQTLIINFLAKLYKNKYYLTF